MIARALATETRAAEDRIVALLTAMMAGEAEETFRLKIRNLIAAIRFCQTPPHRP